MKKNIFTIIFIILTKLVNAQSGTIVLQIVDDGIQLHDQRKYSEAIAKYREALNIEPNSFDALYEISFTFFATEKFDSSIFYSQKLLSLKAPDKFLQGVYVNLGSCYDALKKPEKSIAIYNEGLKQFPNYYLLNFNKGITFSNQNKADEAYESFTKAIRSNPIHSSSHYFLASLNYDKGNRMPALMNAAMVCIQNAGNERGKNCSNLIFEIIKSNVKKNDGGNGYTISLPISDNKENDFSSVELMMSIMETSTQIQDSLHLDSDEKKLSFKLQMIFNGLENSKKKKGIYWTTFAPFFTELKKKNFIDILARLILLQKNKEANQQWLADNKSVVENFTIWVKEYKWTNN